MLRYRFTLWSRFFQVSIFNNSDIVNIVIWVLVQLPHPLWWFAWSNQTATIPVESSRYVGCPDRKSLCSDESGFDPSVESTQTQQLNQDLSSLPHDKGHAKDGPISVVFLSPLEETLPIPTVPI